MADHLFRAVVVFCLSILFQSSASYLDPKLQLYRELLELNGLEDQYFESSSPDEDSAGNYPENYEFDVDLFMPNITPQHINDYKCYSVPTPDDMSVFLVGFKPNSQHNAAHHILLFGCEEPGSQEETWDCGEMTTDVENAATPCNGWPKILYAWAMNAPPLTLPEGVGFEIGGATNIKHLVLQIHYADVDRFKDGVTDESGLTLSVTNEKQPLKAGTYFLGTDGKIPAKSEVHLEAACLYEGGPVLHPFAFRVHAHSLGTVISGYRVRDDQWTEIGKQDPNLPQMFYPVDKTDLTIEEGDVLAARCTMNNYRDKTVFIGPTMDDEMCNFYMMYYTEATETPENEICFTSDGFKWADYLENIPDKEASELPATKPEDEASEQPDKEQEKPAEEAEKGVKAMEMGGVEDE